MNNGDVRYKRSLKMDALLREYNAKRKAHVKEALRRAGGNVTLAAEKCGICRAQYYRLARKFGVLK